MHNLSTELCTGYAQKHSMKNTINMYSLKEVPDIAFRTRTGVTLKLDPMDDVTPLESVRIAALLTTALQTFMPNAGATGCLYDWQAYIDLHKLQRHFKESQ